MDWNILYYLLYGLAAGLGELLPVSADANGYLIGLMTQFDTVNPALRLSIHFACLLAVFLGYNRRIGHIRREMRIARIPQQKRKRQPDLTAVLDAKVIQAGLVPMVIGIVLSTAAYQRLAALPWLCLLLLAGGILLYLPQYLPGANKDSRSLSRKDGLILGFSAALGVVPGFSRLGSMISVGLMKGCERSYILDMAMLASLPILLGLMVVDGIAWAMSGLVISGVAWIYLLTASAAAFGGAWLGMVIMRFLSVKSNFYGFAYFNWGLALFSFLVYLMI